MEPDEESSSRRAVVPPSSSRTLHHPSLLSLYLAAGCAHHHTHSQTSEVILLKAWASAPGSCADRVPCPVEPLSPAEVFYTDPSLTCGGRLPNIVSQLRALDCLQLNTPPPVMSACVAPPNRPDPFRSRLHPVRDLGSPTWTVGTQPNQLVIQLTQEEDEAITNLLRLRHQEPSGPAASSPDSPDPPTDTAHHGHPERRWSDRELKAAHTLVSGFLHRPPCRRGSMPPSPSSDLPVTLSDPERDAVDVLLTLWDTAASDALL